MYLLFLLLELNHTIMVVEYGKTSLKPRVIIHLHVILIFSTPTGLKQARKSSEDAQAG